MMELTCTICGKKFLAETKAFKTCSDECKKFRKKEQSRQSYLKKIAEDPDFLTKQAERIKRRRNEDQDYAKRYAERRSKYEAKKSAFKKERLRIDEGYKAHVNTLARKRYEEKREYVLSQRKENRTQNIQSAREKARLYYETHADEINAKRRTQRDSMTQEQRDKWLNRMREYRRLYARAYRESIRENPELHQKYLDRMREYDRQRRIRDELNKMLSIGAQIITRKGRK